MNAKQLTKTIHDINQSFFWVAYCEGKNDSEIKAVEKYGRFKFLKNDELNNAIESIKAFNINQIWERKFWNLKQHESICAIASDLDRNIKKIKNHENI
jgi:hypothetical protein